MTHTEIAEKALRYLDQTCRFSGSSYLCDLLFATSGKESAELRALIGKRLGNSHTVNRYLLDHHGVSLEDMTVGSDVQEYRRLWLLELAKELDNEDSGDGR